MFKTANVTHLSIKLQKLWQKTLKLITSTHDHATTRNLRTFKCSKTSHFKVCMYLFFVADLQIGLNHSHPTNQVFLKFCRQSKSILPKLAFFNFLPKG